MSTFKKLLALSLALAMVLSFSAFAADYKDDTYKDAANIDKACTDAVELMYALDIMKGDQNGNFNPTGSITRAEIAKMIYVVLNKGNDDQAVNFKYNQMFSDVSGDAWYAGYVNYCAATKLIDGYNGKFLPMQPVTTAQAAKMLLTAIGYSSENRNYTGSNWEKNVLADAAVVGLLENYNWPTNQTAPRQWIAVMFENMLLDAYTYGTARPGTINGLLTGTMGELGGQSIITMGKKYFGLVDYTGYLYGVKNAYIEKVVMAGDKDEKAVEANTGYSNRAVFANSSAKSGRTIRNVKLGYMDLGQQYRVIYSDSDFNDGYNYAYSVRSTGTSKVADAMLKDMESEVNRKTSSNDAANRYIFTISDMEASFNSKSINALILNERPYLKDEDDPDASKLLKNMTPRQLDAIVGEYKTDDYRAVDKDGDGDIDYLIIKEYTYGQVTKVGNHRDYGEYFNAITPVKGNDAGTADYKVTGYGANNITNWYLSDVVNSETAVEKDNAIKVCYNPDADKYDVEVLPVETGEYTKRTQNQLKAHTIGGEEYFAAKDGFENPYLELISKNLKDELTFAYDDNLVVLVGQLSSNITDLAEINAQLVLVMDAYVDIRSNGKNQLYVDYMTIDGEEHEEITYTQDTDEYVDFYDLMDNGIRVGNAINSDVDTDANGNLQNSRELLKKHQRLFKLVEHDDETVSLIKLTPDDLTATENSKDELNYADTLLSGYEEDWGTLNTKKDTFDHDNTHGFNAHGNETDFVNDENVFFVSYLNNKGRMVFDVMTMEELGEGTSATDASFIQGLYYARRSTNTHLAGHIYVGTLNLNQSTGYLYTTDNGAYELDDGDWYLDGVVFGNNANGTEAEEAIYVNSIWDAKQNKYVAVKDENDIKPNCLYAYTYQKSSGTLEYDLRLIDELDPAQDTFVNDANEHFRFDFTYDAAAGTYDPDDAKRIKVAELSDIINRTQDVILKGADGTTITLDDDAIITLKTVTLDRDETQEIGWGDDKTYGFKVSEKIEFVSFNELIEEEDGVSVNHIYDDDAEQNNDTYDYYSDVYYKMDGDCVALYVVVYEVMVEANWID